MTARKLFFEKSVQPEGRPKLREHLLLLVETIVNEGRIRACGTCEEELGPQRGDDNDKSHGLCKRHAIEYCKMLGATALMAKYEAAPDDQFPPDLAKHPELIDHAREAEWRSKRIGNREQMQHEIAART